MAAGYLWRFFNPGGLDRQRVRHGLSTAVLYFFLPALAFSLVATARVDEIFIAVPLTAAITTLLLIAAGIATYRLIPGLKKIPGSVVGVMILAAAFGNVTYLGLPVIAETLGEDRGYLAILYDQLAATPIMLTVGLLIAARYGEGKVSIGGSIRRVLRLPPLWAVMAGIFVNLSGLRLPDPVMETARLMGSAVIPVMIFTVGLALDFGDLRRIAVALPALGLKLFISPIVAWQTGQWLGLTGDPLKAVVMEGAMPVMVLSLVIADEFNLDVPLAATCIAVSTVVSFFTVPWVTGLLF